MQLKLQLIEEYRIMHKLSLSSQLEHRKSRNYNRRLFLTFSKLKHELNICELYLIYIYNYKNLGLHISQ